MNERLAMKQDYFKLQTIITLKLLSKPNYITNLNQ